MLTRREGESVIEWAGRWFERAKVVLATDGYHIPMATLVMPDGSDEMMALKFDDRQAIYVLMYRLARHVQETGATAILVISEFWVGSRDDVTKGIKPSESLTRREALQVQVASAECQLRTYSTLFWRDNKGKIAFGETLIADSAPDEHWGYLEPIHQVWKAWSIMRQNTRSQQDG
jgi:hypothetical protein